MQRLADLNGALRDPKVDAIWCIRVGYGLPRILDQVDFDAPARRPRPLIGYSDITAVLNAANEVAVQAFLEGRLRFDQIHQVNHATLEDFLPSKPHSLEDLMAVDAQARVTASAWVARCAS